jgi:hypothetical protein
MEKQNWEGMHLDKDIIKPGNKIYSPSLCAFIEPWLNTVLGSHESARGIYPQGVSYASHVNLYRAKISIRGKQTHIGHYKTQDEASLAYKKEKKRILISHAKNQTDERIRKGLILHAETFN